MATQSSSVPLHRNRDFLLLWTGQAVSVLGSNISATAYPLLVLALTGSAANVGIVGFAATLPHALFQLPAGALVDRWDRRRLMLACDLGRIIAVSSVVVALAVGQLMIPHLIIVAFVEGALSVFFGLAEQAAVPHVVPTTQLTAALAQNEARVRGAAFLGQPLGGVLFGLSRIVPFLADVASYTVSLLTLLLIRSQFNAERTSERQHLVSEIREGISWLWRQPFLRTCALLVAGSNFMFQALVLTLIVLAQARGASPAVIGLMLGGFGAGGVLGAVAAPWLQQRLAPRFVIVGANWVWAALTPLIALAPNPYVIAVIAGGMAFVGPLWNVVIGAFELHLTPDALRGRVMSVGSLLAFGAIPLGSLVAGFLLEAIGPVATILVLAGWMGLIAVAATLSRSVRQAPRLDAVVSPVEA